MRVWLISDLENEHQPTVTPLYWQPTLWMSFSFFMTMKEEAEKQSELWLHIKFFFFLTWHKRSFTVSSYSHFSQCGWQLLPRALLSTIWCLFFSLWMSQLIPCLCPLHCFHSHQQTSNLLHYINQSPLCSLFKPPRWEFQPWHSPTNLVFLDFISWLFPFCLLPSLEEKPWTLHIEITNA